MLIVLLQRNMPGESWIARGLWSLAVCRETSSMACWMAAESSAPGGCEGADDWRSRQRDAPAHITRVGEIDDSVSMRERAVGKFSGSIERDPWLLRDGQNSFHLRYHRLRGQCVKCGHGYNNPRNADDDPPFAQLLMFDVWSRDIHLTMMWHATDQRLCPRSPFIAIHATMCSSIAAHLRTSLVNSGQRLAYHAHIDLASMVQNLVGHSDRFLSSRKTGFR